MLFSSGRLHTSNKLIQPHQGYHKHNNRQALNEPPCLILIPKLAHTKGALFHDLLETPYPGPPPGLILKVIDQGHLNVRLSEALVQKVTNLRCFSVEWTGHQIEVVIDNCHYLRQPLDTKQGARLSLLATVYFAVFNPTTGTAVLLISCSCFDKFPLIQDLCTVYAVVHSQEDTTVVLNPQWSNEVGQWESHFLRFLLVVLRCCRDLVAEWNQK